MWHLSWESLLIFSRFSKGAVTPQRSQTFDLICTFKLSSAEEQAQRREGGLLGVGARHTGMP